MYYLPLFVYIIGEGHVRACDKKICKTSHLSAICIELPVVNLLLGNNDNIQFHLREKI